MKGDSSTVLFFSFSFSFLIATWLWLMVWFAICKWSCFTQIISKLLIFMFLSVSCLLLPAHYFYFSLKIVGLIKHKDLFSGLEKKIVVLAIKHECQFFYSFLPWSLSCAAISRDASLVCGGFEDSSILLWSLTPKKLVHPKSKPEISKIQLSPGILELFVKVNVFRGA